MVLTPVCPVRGPTDVPVACETLGCPADAAGAIGDRCARSARVISMPGGQEQVG